MISPRIRFEHLAPTAWRNVHRLWSPPMPAGKRRSSAAPLVLFVEQGQCVKALRPGSAPPPTADLVWQGTWSLGRLRRSCGAPWAIAVQDDALDRIAKACEAELRPGEDFVAQSLAVARAVRAEIGRGVHVDPDPLKHVPVPSYTALQKTLDALLPDGRCAVLMIFDESRGRHSPPMASAGSPGAAAAAGEQDPVWCSVIVEKQGGDIARVTSHGALGMRRLGFRRGEHREILDAVSRVVARPHVGVFLSLGAWREVVSPTPGALARQVALGEAVIDPLPPWMVALTGMGAVAGVAQEASRLLGRFIPQSVKETARAVSPFASLGFDPIEVFIELRRVFGGA